PDRQSGRQGRPLADDRHGGIAHPHDVRASRGETPARSRRRGMRRRTPFANGSKRHEVGVGSTTDQNRGTPSEEGMRALVFVALVGAVTTAWACGSPTVPSTVSAGCAPTEATANLHQPVFNRPFDGPSRVGNTFDHDLPLDSAANGYVLTLCGKRDS